MKQLLRSIPTLHNALTPPDLALSGEEQTRRLKGLPPDKGGLRGVASSSIFYHIMIAVFFSAMLFNSNAHAYCFEEAGQLYGINPQVLRSIAGVESGNKPDAVGKNTNGSYDVGLMQINTIWKSTLGLGRWKHLGDACYNTKTGAWILAACISKYGYNWRAVGCYNSQTPEKSEIYAKKVFEKLERLKSGKEPQPLDSDMEAALSAHVQEMVAAKQEGRKLPKKKVLKFVPYTKLSKDKLRQPPPAPAGEPSAPVPVPWK